jgi:hypothetical protein
MNERSGWRNSAIGDALEKLQKSGLGLKGSDFGSPKTRAIFAGRLLARLAAVWAVLSIIGAVIMLFLRTCTDEGNWGSCYEYEHPYVVWAIVSLLINLLVSSFLYACGTFIEARLTESDNS